MVTETYIDWLVSAQSSWQVCASAVADREVQEVVEVSEGISLAGVAAVWGGRRRVNQKTDDVDEKFGWEREKRHSKVRWRI